MTQTRPHRRYLEPETPKKIAWMTDVHLDHADAKATRKFLHDLMTEDYDLAVLTGDIASHKHLAESLAMIAKACGRRPLYVTLGNHDYYGSCIHDTRDLISKLCRQIKNLHHLSTEEAIDLGNGTVLVGCDGWADNQWRGVRTKDIPNPDHRSIIDFRIMHQWARNRLMRKLGAASVDSVRERLRPKLRQAKRVILATHVPPFFSSAFFNGRPCDANHQPHYVHASLGGMLIGLARFNSNKTFLSLSGHTHSECRDHIFVNLTSIVGGHRKHHPKIQQILPA